MIDRIVCADEALRVWLTDCAEPLDLPWFWVRDHSADPATTDPATGQRVVDTFAIDPRLRPARCELVGDEVLVHWNDGAAPAVVPAHLLVPLQPALGGPGTAAATARTLWPDPRSVSVTPVGHRSVVDSDEVLAGLLADLARFGIAQVTDSPAEPAAVEALVDRIGYVRRTIFGDVWRLSSDEVGHADSAYSTTYLEPHSDGSYVGDGPGLQVFSCVERTGTGGESILVDGIAAAEQLRAEQPEAFELLGAVAVPGRYLEPGVELRAERPTIGLSADGTVEQVTFNNYDRAPFLLPVDRLGAWYRAYGAFHELLVDRSRWWVHRLEPGETLLFDNWRCLHGRLAYTGRRTFHGCYLNHEDLEAAWRRHATFTAG